MTNNLHDGVVLALDIGTVRIGVATCRLDVRFPQPLTTINYDEATVVDDIVVLARQQAAVMLVAGWPRGMEGQSTKQTAFVESLVEKLRQSLALPVYLQDEALTSQRAETELQSRKKPYAKGDVDALAATYILEDFMQSAAFNQAYDSLTEAHHV